MSNNELLKKIKEIKDLQNLIDEAYAEMESLKDEIKSYMGDSEEKIIGEYKVTYSRFSSTRVNSNILREQYPEAYKAAAYTTQSRRFSIK